MRDPQNAPDYDDEPRGEPDYEDIVSRRDEEPEDYGRYYGGDFNYPNTLRYER